MAGRYNMVLKPNLHFLPWWLTLNIRYLSFGGPLLPFKLISLGIHNDKWTEWEVKWLRGCEGRTAPLFTCWKENINCSNKLKVLNLFFFSAWTVQTAAWAHMCPVIGPEMDFAVEMPAEGSKMAIGWFKRVYLCSIFSAPGWKASLQDYLDEGWKAKSKICL